MNKPKADSYLQISNQVSIPLSEIEVQAIRSQGTGGQNVNKVSTAIHLRFDIQASSLPDTYKQNLLRLQNRQVTHEGIIIIKAQRHRTQEKNREDALERLNSLIKSTLVTRRKRVATKPSQAAKERRLTNKKQRSQTKQGRSKRWQD